ncbi:Ion transport 2 domain protein (plasmid) [Peptoclostridium acidaminophilum DSM 3953]|uniref:Ion transport 2 domain protein n=1 Tax=Peptoclostridium acidaminophilum DSM 3953 TaxID=1286171 RepID=W8TBE6_PEPAC|nr:potassium channel family protein [Peptoclostridium acidaminophilum]AHM58140.1 Ion transport 2 domain protein [Peptoclostridium acidaminophilum DSM 3953]
MKNKLLNKEKIHLGYELFMAVLALIAVVIAFLDVTGKINMHTGYNEFYYTELVILIIFALDYFTRLFKADNKRLFVRKNIPDLISIIPFNAFLRAFRIVRFVRVLRFIRVIKLFRFFALIKKFKFNINKFIYTNGLIYVIYITIAMIIFGAIGIYHFEYGLSVHSFEDALWWSFVTISSVGYGDIAPVTTYGRLIASLQMIVGMGFAGMLTGTIATYFIGNKIKQTVKTTRGILNLSDMSSEELQIVLEFVDDIRKKRQ